MSDYWRKIVFALLIFSVKFPLVVRAELPRDYSLRAEWDRHWEQILDRHAQPDPRGPIFQRFVGQHYPEYQLDLRVADFPMNRELARVEAKRSVSIWAQSIDELTLANRVQLKDRAPLGDKGYFDLQLDRYQTRQDSLNLVGVEFGRKHIAGSEISAGLKLYPRWHKEDSDFEGVIRFENDDYGTYRLRIFGFDAFNNASHGILESRDEGGNPRVWQKSLPLAASIDWRSPVFSGLRVETYLGGVIPQDTAFEYKDDSETDYRQTKEAFLAGGLAEWNIPGQPMDVGATGSYVRGEVMDERLDGSMIIRKTVEERAKLQTYLMYQPLDSLYLEANIERIYRPETRTESGTTQNRTDRAWFTSLRTEWIPHDIFGLELKLLRLEREASGPPNIDVSGTNYRFVTRPTFQLGRSAWMAFGVGWDLDNPQNVYDGGGFTVMARW